MFLHSFYCFRILYMLLLEILLHSFLNDSALLIKVSNFSNAVMLGMRATISYWNADRKNLLTFHIDF